VFTSALEEHISSFVTIQNTTIHILTIIETLNRLIDLLEAGGQMIYGNENFSEKMLIKIYVKVKWQVCPLYLEQFITVKFWSISSPPPLIVHTCVGCDGINTRTDQN
jgi:hypothetical protein